MLAYVKSLMATGNIGQVFSFKMKIKYNEQKLVASDKNTGVPVLVVFNMIALHYCLLCSFIAVDINNYRQLC